MFAARAGVLSRPVISPHISNSCSLASASQSLLCFNVIQQRVIVELAINHVFQVSACQCVLHAWQAFLVRFKARLQHVAVDAHALLPGIEVAIQVGQVTVILEAFLEFVVASK